MTETSIRLAVDPFSASAARRFLRSRAVRLDPMRLTEADLLVTELVGNVVKHSPDAEYFTLSALPALKGMRFSVRHLHTGPINGVVPGVGFSLVERVAKAWSHEYDGECLTVWFELRTPGASTVDPSMTDEELLARLADDPLTCSDELLRRHSGLALAIASRYGRKGIPQEDLDQVAMMALLRAIQRFDANRGDLRPYAAATISGEMKKALRDRAWSVRVGRSLQERSLGTAKFEDDLAQRLGRDPTSAEIAEEMGLSVEDVAAALDVRSVYRSRSFEDENPVTGESLLARLGEFDERMLDVENRVLLQDGLESLPQRQQLILSMRFEDDLTQSEIAERLGISQMHVSRLLARSLETLRSTLDGSPEYA
jgi:RNA polymerase sigma-B factor